MNFFSKISKKYFTFILISAILVSIPIFTFAQIVPTCPDEGCGFNDLMLLVQNIMSFLIAIAIPLSAIAFAWAGFLYITARGNQSTLEKAHSIFGKVAVGFILVLTAWLIVWLITSTLLNDSATSLLES